VTRGAAAPISQYADAMGIIGGLLFIVFNLLPGRKPAVTAAPQVIAADSTTKQPEEPVTYDAGESPDQPESAGDPTDE